MHKNMFLLTAAAAITLTCGISSARAATLTGVPMQGAMAMPMVGYDAMDGRLYMTMPGEVPQLTPLLVSNPTDHFATGDPWDDLLDPSRQGLSFSRRYGFVMDMMSDPLPAGTVIWLRKLSGPRELGFYRYSGSAPKAWTPIFGTDGTPNALYWDTIMFHPGVTAPPGTNPLTATFEAHLVNTQTGAEVPNSSTGPMVFDWTNVSDGRPALNLALKVVVAWPTTTTNWTLEAASSLPSTQWTAITNPPVMLNGQPAVILDGNAGKKFFRMRYTP